MRLRISVSIATLAAMVSLAQTAAAQAPNPEPAKPAAIASVPPPEGWKACPRCQNADDRQRANAESKVEGHPFNPRDLSGVWGYMGARVFTKPPAFTPWGKQQFDATIGEKNAAGQPLHSKDTSGEGTASPVNCDPKGWPRLHTYNYGFEFVMLPDRVLQFFELTHAWRTIWTDGRKLPANPPEPRWMGWNVGRWEGSTFVIESNGYDDRSWLSDTAPDGGWPHSDEMRVVERWRRVNYGTIEAQITVIDPKTYTEPWVTPASTTVLVPGAELWENLCVPSDYNSFNNDVFLPAATGGNK
jgi:hypothetical protein